MLMRLDPFRELDRLTQRLWATTAVAPLAMDAMRREDRVEILMDIPGVAPEDLDVTVEENVLTVKTERKPMSDGEELLIAERPVGTFTRQLLLGDGLDFERLEAKCENGMLHITVPVSELGKARHVPVTSGGGAIEVGTKERSETAA